MFSLPPTRPAPDGSAFLGLTVFCLSECPSTLLLHSDVTDLWGSLCDAQLLLARGSESGCRNDSGVGRLWGERFKRIPGALT